MALDLDLIGFGALAAKCHALNLPKDAKLEHQNHHTPHSYRC
jgi:hypothetical protein